MKVSRIVLRIKKAYKMQSSHRADIIVGAMAQAELEVWADLSMITAPWLEIVDNSPAALPAIIADSCRLIESENE